MTAIMDGFLALRLGAVVSEMSYGCATATGFALDRLTTTTILAAPVILGCGIGAHLARNRMNRLCRLLVFSLWGIGVALAGTPLLVSALSRVTK
jgi:hypothetical protein